MRRARRRRRPQGPGADRPPRPQGGGAAPARCDLARWHGARVARRRHEPAVVVLFASDRADVSLGEAMMDSDHGFYTMMAELLDSMNIGLCLFDENDGALLWNRTFLRLFPEHNGLITVGEHYSINLRRFYLARLSADELPHLHRYIAEGVARHRTQTQPFVSSSALRREIGRAHV